jgi:hypothetical protein
MTTKRAARRLQEPLPNGSTQAALALSALPVEQQDPMVAAGCQPLYDLGRRVIRVVYEDDLPVVVVIGKGAAQVRHKRPNIARFIASWDYYR